MQQKHLRTSSAHKEQMFTTVASGGWGAPPPRPPQTPQTRFSCTYPPVDHRTVLSQPSERDIIGKLATVCPTKPGVILFICICCPSSLRLLHTTVGWGVERVWGGLGQQTRQR